MKKKRQWLMQIYFPVFLRNYGVKPGLFCLIASIFLVCYPGFAQTKYLVHQGRVTFYSSAPLEDITAGTDQVKAALDVVTGKILVVIPINTFIFRKKLMQEHFNKQYLESDLYPEARFEGTLTKVPVNDGEIVKTFARGLITIHGIKNDLETPVTLSKNGERIQGETVFNVRIKDYKVRIPRIVTKNIAEVVQVDIELEFEPYNGKINGK